MCRVIQAGGGDVLKASSPYSNTPGATHMLTESKFLREGGVDFAGLAGRGVPVLGQIFISDFLLSSRPPALEQHLLQEFRPYWETKQKRSRVTTDTPTSAVKKSKSVLKH